MAKSMFFKLVFVLILLVAWIIYGYRHVIMNTWYETTEAVEQTADKLGLVPEPEVKTSTAYKWTDAEGKVHFSSTPPPAGTQGVEEKQYGDGINVVAAPPRRKPGDEEQKPNLLGPLPEIMENARQARELADQAGAAAGKSQH